MLYSSYSLVWDLFGRIRCPPTSGWRRAPCDCVELPSTYGIEKTRMKASRSGGSSGKFGRIRRLRRESELGAPRDNDLLRFGRVKQNDDDWHSAHAVDPHIPCDQRRKCRYWQHIIDHGSGDVSVRYKSSWGSGHQYVCSHLHEHRGQPTFPARKRGGSNAASGADRTHIGRISRGSTLAPCDCAKCSPAHRIERNDWCGDL